MGVDSANPERNFVMTRGAGSALHDTMRPAWRQLDCTV